MPLRMFADPGFAKWAEDEDVTDAMLSAAAREIANGLVDARIGDSLFKKRVAAPGRGKSRSYRVIVAWKYGDKLFFLHGFAKNEKDNISQREKTALARLAELYMSYNDATLAELVNDGDLLEIEQ